MGSRRKKKAIGLAKKQRQKERNKMFHANQELYRHFTRTRNSQFYTFHKKMK